MDNLEKLKNYLKNVLDEPTRKKWIEPLKYIGSVDKTLFLGSPDQKNLRWIKQNLLEEINSYTRKQFDFITKIVPLGEDDLTTEMREPAEESFYHDTRLQKRYTFESLVQSDSNRIAYSFAHSVSEFPGKSYNPLYIYSDVGLGKTHLMQAIGNRIIENNKKTNVVYLTTSDFMNEYVEYTRLNKRQDFTKKYTSVDVLLIDDIQYITKWGGTSEQFYYIFNNLIQQEKQIVICSDKHPDNMPDLEKRIKSRFEMGAIVDIFPYDLEARIAILQKKISERKNTFHNDFTIPNEVIEFLANSIKDNIRKLEGALNRLMGYADLKHADLQSTTITLPFAKEALRPYINIEKKTITIDTIQEFVSEKFDIRIEDLKSKNNSPKIALPRQVAMYLAKKLTRSPLVEIGLAFSGKHHTTVLHSVNKIEKMLQIDNEFSRKVNSYVEFFTD
ncbi:MAG: chromosomal replication initiator protein DnaA [Candidatus Aminicenantes bacterium]|nr:chromosomal replication initiator protein DnaA [Candidatus Aminicenantes bacterium]